MGFPLLKKFRSSYQHRPSTDCWIWTGPKTKNGYGIFHIANRTHHAHRVSYELFIGGIPARLFVCHRCDCRDCVNPAHLWLGTNSQNMIDCLKKGRARTKLNETQVRRIFHTVTTERLSRTEAAARFHVSTSAIDEIVHGKTWRHLGLRFLERLPRHGGRRYGEAHANCSVSRSTVRKIRACANTESYRVLGARFGLSASHVWRIIHRLSRTTE